MAGLLLQDGSGGKLTQFRRLWNVDCPRCHKRPIEMVYDDVTEEFHLTCTLCEYKIGEQQEKHSKLP